VQYADETKDVDLMLKSAWKLKSWKKLKETVRKAQTQREPSFDLELAKAYHMIATSDEINVAAIEKICEDATGLALRQWRSLPAIVSHSHIPILEASQRFVELQVSAITVVPLGISTRLEITARCAS
jgi:transformation/transcription domain-associated protein